jgi:hypothetical protein
MRGFGRERGPAHRTVRLVITTIEFRGSAWSRSDDAVSRASIATVAIDDHAARHDQAASELALVQRAEQATGAEIVAADVFIDVIEVDAEADHGRVVRDGVDAIESGVQRGCVGDVGPYVLGVIVEVFGFVVVRRGVQNVDDDDRVPIGDQTVDDV